jgi:decaprenylphospho-beta-D-ribofuranose 2-oxidase
MPTSAAATFVSMDGTATVSGFLTEPDRYRHLLDAGRPGPVIARGSGLSYVAASMGPGILSIATRYFDRILAFDPETGLIEVEAGARLGPLLSFLLERGYILPVIPGHPAITIGGCIACDVHGKNPARDRTFREHVVALELWHPKLGLRSIRAGTPDFDATCGGYGLTGMIVSARIRAQKVGGTAVRIDLTPVRDLGEAHAILTEKAPRADFLYSWHDWSRPGSTLGFVVEGTITAGPRAPTQFAASLERGARFPVMNRLTIPLFNAAYGAKLARKNGRVAPLTDALFPIASLAAYYRLYRRGLIEHQVLISQAAWPDYWPALGKLFDDHGVRPVVSSLKMFQGERQGVGFSGAGISLTFDLVNNDRSRALLSRLDAIDCDIGALTNPAKDSRLTATVFRRQTPDLPSFLARRAVLDPDRSFRSALSQRLAL